MKDKEKNDQKIYRVRVYKDFDYPSFSIDKNNKLQDLSYKIIEDLHENINHNANLDTYFNFEILQVLPFSLNHQIEETTNNTNYDFFIREIALDILQQKYGEINYAKNPDIFEMSKKTDTEVVFTLKPEIEDHYVTMVKKMTKMINEKSVNFGSGHINPGNGGRIRRG